MSVVQMRKQKLSKVDHCPLAHLLLLMEEKYSNPGHMIQFMVLAVPGGFPSPRSHVTG